VVEVRIQAEIEAEVLAGDVIPNEINRSVGAEILDLVLYALNTNRAKGGCRSFFGDDVEVRFDAGEEVVWHRRALREEEATEALHERYHQYVDKGPARKSTPKFKDFEFVSPTRCQPERAHRKSTPKEHAAVGLLAVPQNPANTVRVASAWSGLCSRTSSYIT
jgi:hypothetical protein